jgi:ABC-type antimicrobial peptide transport system permease subunit
LPSLASIALRYIARHKLRNLFTVLTIMIGVALIIGVSVTFDSVIVQYQATASKSTGNVDITITSLQDSFNQTILNDIQSIGGVVNASARLSRIAELVGQNKTVTVVGIDSPTDFEFQDLNFSMASLKKEFKLDSSDIAVSAGQNYSIGQTLQIRFYEMTALDQAAQSSAILGENQTESHTFRVVAAYGGRNTQIYADLAKIQAICNLTGIIDSIDVKVSSYDLTDQVVNAINREIGSTYIVDPVKQDILGSVEETTGGLSYGLKIVSIIALCVSIIVVLNSMYMNVSEKTREIGILRSIGSSKLQVFWLFFAQSLILGIVGVTLGTGAGILLTSLFKHLVNLFAGHIYTTQQLTMLFDASYIPYMQTGAVAGIVATITGGVFPSLSASRVEIIRSLRPTMRKSGKQRTALKLIGVGLPLTLFGVMEYYGFIFYSNDFALLMVYLLIPLVGVIFLAAGVIRMANRGMASLLFMFKSNSRVISRNIDRNLFKTTACFTMIGLSLSFLVVIGGAQAGITSGMEDVIKSYISCDITVVAETNLTRTFSQNITGINGGNLIESVTPALIVPEKTVLINNKSDTKTAVTLIAIDSETYPTVMQMSFSEGTQTNVFQELDSPGHIILTAPLAHSLNVSVNDRLQLPTVQIVVVSIDIPNPALNNLTQKQIAPSHALGITLPATISVEVPQVQVTYHNFTVTGIAEGSWLRAASFSGIKLAKACYISYNSLNDIYPKHKDEATVFFAAAKTGADLEAAKQQIESEYGSKYNLDMVTRNQIVNDIRGDIDRIFLSLYIPSLFAAINAVIGVLSIMLMNIGSRKREIGILRSQGMSRLQVITSIIGEVLVLGTVGFLIALGLGVIFQSIVVTFMNLSGFVMPFVISAISIEIALVEAVAISVLSAAYPAYRASKLDIVDSLRAI